MACAGTEGSGRQARRWQGDEARGKRAGQGDIRALPRYPNTNTSNIFLKTIDFSKVKIFFQKIQNIFLSTRANPYVLLGIYIGWIDPGGNIRGGLASA